MSHTRPASSLTKSDEIKPQVPYYVTALYNRKSLGARNIGVGFSDATELEDLEFLNSLKEFQNVKNVCPMLDEDQAIFQEALWQWSSVAHINFSYYASNDPKVNITVFNVQLEGMAYGCTIHEEEVGNAWIGLVQTHENLLNCP